MFIIVKIVKKKENIINPLLNYPMKLKKNQKHDSDTKLILQMLQDKDEALFCNEYEYIATSDYDSIATLLPELIQAYYKHEIYDYSSDDINATIGTIHNKTEALALYLEDMAKRIRNKEFEKENE
jgi:hypothetical protein